MRLAPYFFIYGPIMADSSDLSGGTAAVDGPAMLAAESELLEALNRLGSADSDVEWQQAVSARDHALRRLLIAVSDLPLETRELVVARATRALASDRRTPPKGSCPVTRDADAD